jgi:hypothetical protein
VALVKPNARSVFSGRKRVAARSGSVIVMCGNEELGERSQLNRD